MTARLAILAACLVAAACHTPATGPYSPPTQDDRQPEAASALNREAADLITSDPDRAEKLLRESLSLDLFCGPAHNNLGVIFLERGQLYEAAQEFEWARKLMPEAVDPKINLGIALTRASRYDDAALTFQSILDVTPGSVAAAQGLAAVLLRAGHDTDPRIASLLDQIRSKSDNQEWRTWAMNRL